MTIDLTQYQPKASKFKAILKKHGVTIRVVSKYLGINYPYTNHLLAGRTKMPAHIEKKLQVLAEQLETKGAAGCDLISDYVYDKPVPTEYKEILRRHGISIPTVANYMDLTYSYVYNSLHGIYKISRPMKRKLDVLVAQLEPALDLGPEQQNAGTAAAI